MTDSHLSPWQQYKKNLGDARPWHLLDKENYVSKEISDKRFSICQACPELIKATNQCKKCGCFMKAKVKIKISTCPLNKW
jgi:hypothetical protein